MKTSTHHLMSLINKYDKKLAIDIIDNKYNHWKANTSQYYFKSFNYSKHLTNTYLLTNLVRPSPDAMLPTDSLGLWVPFFFVRTFTPERSYLGNGWTKPKWPPLPKNAPWGLDDALWAEGVNLLESNTAIEYYHSEHLKSRISPGVVDILNLDGKLKKKDHSLTCVPCMETLSKAATLLLDENEATEFLAFSSRIKHETKSLYRKKTPPHEPMWDEQCKNNPKILSQFFVWAKAEWARLSIENIKPVEIEYLKTTYNRISQTHATLCILQLKATKSLTRFVNWQ